MLVVSWEDFLRKHPHESKWGMSPPTSVCLMLSALVLVEDQKSSTQKMLKRLVPPVESGQSNVTITVTKLLFFFVCFCFFNVINFSLPVHFCLFILFILDLYSWGNLWSRIATSKLHYSSSYNIQLMIESREYGSIANAVWK